MSPTGAKANRRREALCRLWPLALVPLALGFSRATQAQVSTDAGVNRAFTLPGSALDNAAASSQTPPPANAYGVGVGVGETDNVALTAANRTSQTMAIAEVDFSVDHQTRLLDANAVGTFSYIDYLQGAFKPELLGRLDGVADLAIIPGSLIWTLRDTFGQSSVDPYTPTTPGNTENINYLTTGPELKLRFGGVNFVDVNLLYGRAQFQTSPFDSNRALGSVAVGRDVSAGGSISLNATSERVMFDNTDINGDLTLSSAFARYELVSERTQLVGELGLTSAKQDSAGSASAGAALVQPAPGVSLTGPLIKLELTRRISASSRLIFLGGQVLTDAASSFSAQGVGATGIPTITPGYLSGGVFRETYASAGWQFQRNRTLVAVTGRWERDVYPEQPSLESVTPSAQFNAQRRMSRAWTLELLGNWNQGHYPNAVLSQQMTGSTHQDLDRIGAGVIWRHGRGLEVRLRVSHDSYTVSNGNTGYHESRVFLTVGYRPVNLEQSE
jgi:hypothetical protein